MAPKFVDKTYFVRIDGVLHKGEQQQLEKGIVIEGEKTAPAKISRVRSVQKSTEFELTIHEGRKRQIRLMVAALGHKVLDLKRLRQGPLELGDLPLGKIRKLLTAEIASLKKLSS